MAAEFEHQVLIVDDESEVVTAIGRILENEGVICVSAASGQKALEKIKQSETPFSLILSDQRMPGMTGVELLKKAKEISPDTVRVLITGFSDMEALVNAINTGAIHKYIKKPWQNDALAAVVRQGLEQFKQELENERLLKLAKKQNQKLYRLDCELKEKTRECEKQIAALDKEIAEREKETRNTDVSEPKAVPFSLEKLESLLKEADMLDPEGLDSLYAATVRELYERFRDTAGRNGFEMPEAAEGKADEQ